LLAAAAFWWPANLARQQQQLTKTQSFDSRQQQQQSFDSSNTWQQKLIQTDIFKQDNDCRRVQATKICDMWTTNSNLPSTSRVVLEKPICFTWQMSFALGKIRDLPSEG